MSWHYLPTILRSIIVAWIYLCLLTQAQAAPPAWNDGERALLSLQWLGSLPGLTPDPGNRYADDSLAVRFGHQLFFDTRLSANGKVSCASCHQPARHFTGLAPDPSPPADSNRPGSPNGFSTPA